jgi:hypothetical protein
MILLDVTRYVGDTWKMKKKEMIKKEKWKHEKNGKKIKIKKWKKYWEKMAGTPTLGWMKR